MYNIYRKTNVGRVNVMSRKRRRKLKTSVKITLLVVALAVVTGIFGYNTIEKYRNAPDPSGKIEESQKPKPDDGTIEKDGDIDSDSDDEMKLSFKVIDAGKGEAVLVRINEKSVLIDTGSKAASDSVLQKVDESTSGDIDYLILTSNTKGRTGCIKKVFKNFNVKKVLYGEFGKDEETIIKLAKKNDTEVIKEKATTIDLGNGAIITTFQPENRSKDIKDKSLVVLVEYGSGIFYIGSDAGEYEERRMISRLNEEKVSVYLAARRGSSKTNYLLNHISPNYVVLSRTKKENVSDKLINRCSTDNIYKTGLCGDMEFICSRQNVELLHEYEYKEKGYVIQAEDR